MTIFWIALIAFLVSHGIFARTLLRSFLVRHLGEKVYLILYSLLSLILLAWSIKVAIKTPQTPLWPWKHELYWIPNIFMPFVFIFIAAGFIVPNPFISYTSKL